MICGILIRQNKGIKRILILLNAIDNFKFVELTETEQEYVAMLLLGREDYDYLFNTVPEASWRVFDSRNEISDYEIFKIPYITLSERLFGKIRNLTYRYMPNQLTLFPTEAKQYDMWLLKEVINNCIAHSEYTLGGRIYLNEFEDKIIFTNLGSSLPGKIEKVLDPGYNHNRFRESAEVILDTCQGFKQVRSKFYPRFIQADAKNPLKTRVFLVKLK